MKVVSLTFFKGGSEGKADYFSEPELGFVNFSENYRLLSHNRPERYGGLFSACLVIEEGSI